MLAHLLVEALDEVCDVSAEFLVEPGGNCIKIGLPGKLILGDNFQENMTSRRPFILLRTTFPGRPIYIKFLPVPLGDLRDLRRQPLDGGLRREELVGGAVRVSLVPAVNLVHGLDPGKIQG